jgi:tetratricopeptide (TPR) repeat protein
MKQFTLDRVAVALAVVVGAGSLMLGDYNRAESHLRKFYAQVAREDFRQANKSITEAIQRWPSNARYYGWRGFLRSQELPSQCPAHGEPLTPKTLQQVRQAAEDYAHALRLNSRDAVGHHDLAWLEHLMGRDAEARREYEQAVSIDPDTAIFHLSLGLLLEELGDSSGGDAQYLAAIERTPAILDSPFFARLHTRFPERAELIVQKAISRTEDRLRNTNDPILKARLGKFFLYGRDLERAGNLLQSAAADLPNLPLAWFNLGEVRRLQGRRDEAWSCYGKARFVDAGLAGPYLRMAQMYREAGQRNGAIENFRSAAQRWSHVNPVTAAHNNRLYGGPPQTIDDLLPTTLVWYTSPCEASAAYTALAEMLPENQLYASRSRTCEMLPAPHGERAP